MREAIKGHPKSLLYAIVGDEPTEELMDTFEDRLKQIAMKRKWVISPPALVDYFDDSPNGQDSTHTFGCALQLYSAQPPWGERIPKDVDREHLEEVEYLLDELIEITRITGCKFRLQLDQIAMGFIASGELDKTIREGFINEWRKVHTSRD